MTYQEKVHEFAVKWHHNFSEPNIDYNELVDHYLADDCNSLGFEMDCGDRFAEKHGKAVYDSEILVQIIDEVTDIALLGSAIYSRWRYFNHVAYDCAEILESENRAWFMVALGRLALLTG